MTQSEAVFKTIDRLGGIATLGQLYQETFRIKDCKWGTKTPFASIRRIVQDLDKKGILIKLRPGLYAIPTQNTIRLQATSDKPEANAFTHSYYQGLLVEIGKMEHYSTYIPAQDKNKKFLTNTLGAVADTIALPDFTYKDILSRARTIDVLWFNNRHFINSAFEIEHSTDIQNSLLKFVELQDFNIKFSIIADDKRENEFNKKINYTAFESIRDRVKFHSYSEISDLHSNLSRLHALNSSIL